MASGVNRHGKAVGIAMPSAPVDPQPVEFVQHKGAKVKRLRNDLDLLIGVATLGGDGYDRQKKERM